MKNHWYQDNETWRATFYAPDGRERRFVVVTSPSGREEAETKERANGYVPFKELGRDAQDTVMLGAPRKP